MGTKPSNTRYSASGKKLRFPEAYEELQANCCRNPGCAGFGVEAMAWVKQGRPAHGEEGLRDDYRLTNRSKSSPDGKLKCQLCGRTTAIKSNQGIREELKRISAYLSPLSEPSCPTGECVSHTLGVYSYPGAYTCKGVFPTSRRMKCKTCGAAFSVSTTAIKGQKKAEKNRTVFLELVTKKPIRGVAEIADLSPKAVYGKIDFIYQQCLGFLGEREADAHRKRRKYVRLCIDKQDYMINWRSRNFRRNVQFTSIATVEGKTGYVLGHHLNYDPDVSQVDVDDLAMANGDLLAGSRAHFQAQPQYWKTDEFSAYAKAAGYDVRPDIYQEPLPVEDLIELKNGTMENWPRPEMSDFPGRKNSLPMIGAMTHADYTTHAHALLVRRLIGTARYLDIYIDQDELLRNAFLSAFKGQVMADQANMACVQFQKHMIVDEKRDLVERSRRQIAALSAAYQLDRELMIARKMAVDYAIAAASTDDWRKIWVAHPKDTMNEPRRRIQFLTDTGRKNLNDIGWTLSGASLAPVDTYFMRVRRLIYYLERPIPSHTNADRLYYGYAPYDPKRVHQVLTIFRAYTNFVKTNSKCVTPAMKFGLAKGPVRAEEILYWRPRRWR